MIQENSNIVFDKDWFQKHQSKLLWFLNTPVIKIWFRWCMRILKNTDLSLNTKIIEITPNSYSWGNDIEKTTDFRTHDKFSKRLYFAFKPLWYTLHAFDWAMLDRVEALTQLSFGFSTLTKYPGSIGTHNPVDGLIEHYINTGYSDVNACWAAVHDASTGTNIYYTRVVAGALRGPGHPMYYENINILRGFALFDTSALTADANISAAVFSGYNSYRVIQFTDNYSYFNVYSASPASTASLKTGDFDRLGTTGLATALRAESIGYNTYNNYTLNASGRAAISKTGISKFGLREGHDAENVVPPSEGQNAIQYYSSDDSGTSRDPKLVVTYATNAPTVTTQAVSSIAGTTATGNGTVTDGGGSPVSVRGVCWSTSANPTTADSTSAVSGTTGAFTAPITGLSFLTLYHVRAYATNEAGTAYGADVTFTTYGAPSLTTEAASSVAATTVTGNGTITNINGENADVRGFVYSTTSHSDPGNVAPASSAYSGVATDTGDFSTGAFTKSITGLISRTTYYVRAYAHNSYGYWYGDEESFTTIGFTNPGNVYASDNTYSTLAATSGELTVELSKDAGANWQTALTKTFGASDTLETYGSGSTELWGASWIRSDMTDANFRVRLSHGNISQVYKTFGFATGSELLTGIEIKVEANYAASVLSIDLLTVKIYFGSSILPVQAGSQVFASDGRKAGEGVGAGTGVFVFFDGTSWIACDTGTAVAA